MFNSSSNSFSIPFGFYPQKRESEQSLFNRKTENLIKSLKHRFVTRESDIRAFVADVENHAETYGGMDVTRMQDRLRELRFYVRQKNINATYLAETFAIVREVSGRTMGMRHYPHQIIGAWAMLQGIVVEMETGQGKSLCATLAASAAAIAGVSTHVITVNEYLASRDAESFSPLYVALGLTVDFVGESMDDAQKRQAYKSNIVYSTNKQIAFDYLRDRLQIGEDHGSTLLQVESLYAVSPRVNRLLLTGLEFAIIDEADSVLVDEALTPLIISASKPEKDKQRIYESGLQLACQLKADVHFRVNARQRNITLTEPGKKKLVQLGARLGGFWQGVRPRDELVVQALKALHLFHPNQHYLVRDGVIHIIDEFTGRVMEGRSWDAGLHQMIEIKESCDITSARDTIARISYQRFFRRYVNLAGMTGTAQDIKKELRDVYGLPVLTVPPAQPTKRKFQPTHYCLTEDAKWQKVIAITTALFSENKPVLIGVKTLQASVLFSRMLDQQHLPHQLLNASQDKNEADIIAAAGNLGSITVATNMAGRGTDIKLPESAILIGGLRVIATERHEARRIDRQLYGRCGRQGDPGEIYEVLSLEDPILQKNCPRWLISAVKIIAPLHAKAYRFAAKWLFHICQTSIERHQKKSRKWVMESDKNSGKSLSFSGAGE